MEKQDFGVGHNKWEIHCFNTVVVGSGAAGFSAADRLYRFGQKDIAVVTENLYAGTSRNTGSDKQTYYKLSLAGEEADSVESMAQSYFEGQCVDGDLALCEAALSVQCFMNLVEAGVPFPVDRYGEYVGYKTDHDPKRRATSAGPYTSKLMTESLQQAVERNGTSIFGHYQAVRILQADGRVRGVMCLNRDTWEFAFFLRRNLILDTGAPAGMYARSVYPSGHFGSTGIAFEAGAMGKNLTEWQFGMASVRPRWNVSGTYMQALPRFVSTDQDGGEEREFLTEYFSNSGDMLSRIFLKGYQWPFDIRKVPDGSSVIDLIVYQEIHGKGRRVFLDFRQNPGGGDIDFGKLSEEARTYLEKAGACFGTPIQRLKRMNAPAVEFFLDKGVDLEQEMLEIAVCAQHNNGGLAVDTWWQTNVPGLFAIGEISGTHGVYRPGGSALNAGQVGALRAARYIAAKCRQEPDPPEEVFAACHDQIQEILQLAGMAEQNGQENLAPVWRHARERMSRVGAIIRKRKELSEACREIQAELDTFAEQVGVGSRKQLGAWFRLRETLICQLVYLKAMEDYEEHGGRSRGSCLYSEPDGILANPKLPDEFRFHLDDGRMGGLIQECLYQDGNVTYRWRPVRPIPQEDGFFENVWREFRQKGGVC